MNWPFIQINPPPKVEQFPLWRLKLGVDPINSSLLTQSVGDRNASPHPLPLLYRELPGHTPIVWVQ